MPGIDLLPPKIELSINMQIQLRVLSGVLFELTEICDVHIEKDLMKGIIERDVIKEIILKFKDSDGNIYGIIRFLIDWERLELLAEIDGSRELYQGIDFSEGYCNALDKTLLKMLKNHVKQLREAYNIDTIACSFRYREKYTETEEIHNAARQYMGHVWGKEEKKVLNKQFSKSLETAFQGMNNILHIKFEFD